MFTKKDENQKETTNTSGWGSKGSKEPKVSMEDINKVYDKIEELEEDLNWVCNKMDQVLSRLGLQDE